mmetsp:Transcript_70076/g.194797  ORF Transcript_70076/g.194797 Transcript_70076/m.194797 type:complete len:281 (-) Transcript_70076:821-1663(-)
MHNLRRIAELVDVAVVELLLVLRLNDEIPRVLPQPRALLLPLSERCPSSAATLALTQHPPPSLRFLTVRLLYLASFLAPAYATLSSTGARRTLRTSRASGAGRPATPGRRTTILAVSTTPHMAHHLAPPLSSIRRTTASWASPRAAPGASPWAAVWAAHWAAATALRTAPGAASGAAPGDAPGAAPGRSAATKRSGPVLLASGAWAAREDTARLLAEHFPGVAEASPDQINLHMYDFGIVDNSGLELFPELALGFEPAALWITIVTFRWSHVDASCRPRP